MIRSKVNFQYIIDFDYNYEYSCEDSGCNSEGICRCGRIYEEKIKFVNINKLTNFFYDKFFTDDSKCGLRNEKLNTILYGGSEIDKYCINRILTHNRLYNKDIWDISVSSGYYGDEINGVFLQEEILSSMISSCNKILSMNTLSEKIKYVLTTEYEYLLDILKDSNFEIIEIDRSLIDLKHVNQKHLTAVKNKDLSFYSDYDLPLGIVKKVSDEPLTYKIVDGFHRIVSTTKSNFKVFCLC